MGIVKCYFRILLTFLGSLLFFTTSKSQSAHTHADYFKAALDAKTLKEATDYTRKACTLAIKEGQFTTASRYYFRMTGTFYKQKHYLVGIRHAQKGLLVARHYALDSDTLSFKYFSLLASMYSRLAMNDSASYWYNQTERLIRTRPRLLQLIPDYIEAHYYNEGIYFVRLGDQERAVVYIRKSVEMAEATGDERSAALSYLQLANYYLLIYEYRQAAVYYRKALSGFAPESTEACWAYALLGNCFRADGNLAEGLKWLRTSKKKYALFVRKNSQKRDTNFEIESSYYLGRCEQIAGLDKAASDSYRACIQVYQQLYGNRGELVAASWSGLAAIALKQKQFTNALTLAQRALLASTVLFSQTSVLQNPDSDDIKAGNALYEALRLKGTIWFSLYKSTDDSKALQQSIQTFNMALQVAQRIRRSFTQLDCFERLRGQYGSVTKRRGFTQSGPCVPVGWLSNDPDYLLGSP